MENRYAILREELDFRLHSAELDGQPFEQAMGDVIRLALTLAVAFDGPHRTEATILRHLAHMRESFPSIYGTGSPSTFSGNA